MEVVKGSRPHRVNMDGKSCTELGVSAVALLPGTLVHFASGKFAVNATKRPASFVVQCADNVGGSILDAIPAGDSVTGDRAEEGRIYAMRVKAGTVCKENETLLKLDATAADGTLEIATGPEDDVIGVAFETYTVPATPAASHVKVRLT